MLIKKYGNRRLYDTVGSRYITLEELADMIRRGAEPRVVDAKTNEDLTQATLAQIIVEGRGAARLLPEALLLQLVRLGDDALAEFFGRYLTFALEMYMQAKQNAMSMTSMNPFAQAPGFGGTFGRMMNPFAAFGSMMGQGAPPPPMTAAAPAPPSDDVAALRRELEALKRAVDRGPAKKRAARKK
jgi:polyhydroxyalkanoate synthesis repressor PhaR